MTILYDSSSYLYDDPKLRYDGDLAHVIVTMSAIQMTATPHSPTLSIATRTVTSAIQLISQTNTVVTGTRKDLTVSQNTSTFTPQSPAVGIRKDITVTTTSMTALPKTTVAGTRLDLSVDVIMLTFNIFSVDLRSQVSPQTVLHSPIEKIITQQSAIEKLVTLESKIR